MRAELLIRERVVYPDGSLVEMVVWRVPRPVAPSPHGFKYRFAYVVGRKRLVGYDNERGKGDHRHFMGRERAFTFTSIEELLARFVAEVEALRNEQ
ncbi:MAG: hypothetical protein HYR63_28740 [Proteobacteria bacterium]|nr:hypothetical protein [Pseudomonadota bacterium]MBI3496825.1 hypothetical protein [Pseudomonadota bacterium]